MATILSQNHASTSRFYAISNGGGDRKVDFLSVKKALISKFLIHDLDEIIVCRTAAGSSYRNTVERIHAVANLGLQSVGMMRQKMSPDMKLFKKKFNSNNELREATKRRDGLKEALNESPSVSIDLLKSFFS